VGASLLCTGAVQLETFIEPKDLVENPLFQEQRRKILDGLSDDMIDAPIIGLVKGFNGLPFCFTLQSCYGHFIHKNQRDPHNLETLPATATVDGVEYRIAYLCLCIENSPLGRGLLEALRKTAAIDPDNIQFCCAEWFWKRQVNSYALQVMPDRFKHDDCALLDHREALHVEKLRNELFIRLHGLLQEQLRRHESS
jgi:hypothetical protein